MNRVLGLVLGIRLLSACAGGEAPADPPANPSPDDVGETVEMIDPTTEIVDVETILDVPTVTAGAAVPVQCQLIGHNGEVIADDNFEVTTEFTPVENFIFVDGEQAFAATAGDATVACAAPMLELVDETPAEFTIVPGPAHTVTTSLSETEITAGGSSTATCTAVDAYGNAIEDASYELEVSPTGEGISVADLTLTVQQAGTFDVTCKVTGASVLESAQLTVRAGLPAAIALARSPDLSVYHLGDFVDFDALVTDQFGNAITDAVVDFSRTPEGGTTALAASRFQFDDQGTYTVTASVAAPTFEDLPVQDTTEIVVGGLGPVISCTSPVEASSVDHAPGAALSLQGTATDPNGVVSLTVDGAAVTVDAEGSFSTSIVPRFGINFVELTATDALGEESSAICSFLVADQWQSYYGYLDDGVALELDDAAIDDHGGRDELDSFGDLLDTVLNSDGLIDAAHTELDRNPTFKPWECDATGLFGECWFRSGIWYAPYTSSPGMRLDDGDVSLDPVTDGLRARVGLDDIGIRITLQAWAPILGTSTTTGWVEVNSLDVDVTFDVGLQGSRPSVSVRSVNSVSVTDPDFTNFSGWIGDVLDFIDFIDFAGIIEDAIDNALIPVIENALSSFIEDNFNELLDGLISQLDISSLGTSFSVPTLDGESSVTLSFNTRFSTVDFDSSNALFGLGTRFSAPLAYYRSNRGIPLHDDSVLYDPYTYSGGTTAISMNVGLINQVLFALWRGGFFNVEIDPSMLSAEVPEGVTAELEVRMPPVAAVVPYTSANTLRAMVGGARLRVTYPPLINDPIEVDVAGSLLITFDLSGGTFSAYAFDIDEVSLEELHLSLPGAQLTPAERTALEALAQGLLEDAITDAISEGLPAIPIPTFPIPDSAAEFDLPAGRRLGLLSPSIYTSGDEHVYLRGSFGLQPSVVIGTVLVLPSFSR